MTLLPDSIYRMGTLRKGANEPGGFGNKQGGMINVFLRCDSINLRKKEFFLIGCHTITPSRRIFLKKGPCRVRNLSLSTKTHPTTMPYSRHNSVTIEPVR